MLQDCSQLEVDRGMVVDMSPDTLNATIRCNFAAVREEISDQCVNGTWNGTKCEFIGKRSKVVPQVTPL